MRRPLPALLTLALLLAAPGARADFFGAPVALYAPTADEAATEPQGEPAPTISDITVVGKEEPAFGFAWNTEKQKWEATHKSNCSSLTLHNNSGTDATLSLSYTVTTAEPVGVDATVPEQQLLRVLGLSDMSNGEAKPTLSVTVPSQKDLIVYLFYEAHPPASGGDASLRLDVTVTYTLQ